MTTTTPEQAKTPAPPPAGGNGRKRMRIDLSQYGILAALVVIVLLFQVLTGGRLLYPGNVSNLIQQNAYVLILDEPTRGIDVGAKFEIYGIINEMAAQGKAVIVISSELPELIGLCDRIYTIAEGRLTAEVPRDDATQEELMRHMTAARIEGAQGQ